MRNFKIGSKVESKKNSYEIVITFMVGDADGEEKVNLVFDENKMSDPSFVECLNDFIDSIEGCVELDSNGRLGFCDVSECVEWYAGGFDRCGDKYNGVPSWSRFCSDVEGFQLRGKIKGDLNKMKPFENSILNYYIPTDIDGYYHSYDLVEMYYYDSEGNKHEVEI